MAGTEATTCHPRACGAAVPSLGTASPTPPRAAGKVLCLPVLTLARSPHDARVGRVATAGTFLTLKNYFGPRRPKRKPIGVGPNLSRRAGRLRWNGLGPL